MHVIKKKCILEYLNNYLTLNTMKLKVSSLFSLIVLNFIHEVKSQNFLESETKVIAKKAKIKDTKDSSN